MRNKKIQLEDDMKETVSLMIEHRLPWLLLGLGGGIMKCCRGCGNEAYTLFNGFALCFGHWREYQNLIQVSCLQAGAEIVYR